MCLYVNQERTRHYNFIESHPKYFIKLQFESYHIWHETSLIIQRMHNLFLGDKNPCLFLITARGLNETRPTK